MNVINVLLGNIVYGIAKLVSFIMDSIIRLLVNIVLFIKTISKGFMALLSMGGCLFFIFFASWGFRLLMDPLGLLVIMFFIIFPILGSIFVSHLKYLKHITTEYLFNLSNHLKDSETYKYKSFGDYKAAYRRTEEERIREEQRRRYEQQRQWQEQFFKQQWQNFGNQGGQSYRGNGGHQSGFGMNPGAEFKNKYEKSCDILGIPYGVDRNQIKLAYRKKAKEFHPDLNKDPNATKIFQQITDAYEFLSDENIRRYKNL